MTNQIIIAAGDSKVKFCRFCVLLPPQSHPVNDSNSFPMRMFAEDGIVCRGKGNGKGDLTFQMFVPPPTMPALDKPAACFDPSMCHPSPDQCSPTHQTKHYQRGMEMSWAFSSQIKHEQIGLGIGWRFSLQYFEHFPQFFRPKIIKRQDDKGRGQKE